MDFLVTENAFFRIEHCYSCAVPGYLIVSANIAVVCVHELAPSYQAQLGPSLAAACDLIQDVIKPVKVYCAQFGEEGRELHLHVFPRTADITNEFLKAYPEQKALIHGPVLLDWARTRYQASKEKVWPLVSSVIHEMRKRSAMRAY